MPRMPRKDAFITMKTNPRKDGNTGKSAKVAETIKFRKDGSSLVIKKHASSSAKEKFTHQVVASMMKILKVTGNFSFDSFLESRHIVDDVI